MIFILNRNVTKKDLEKYNNFLFDTSHVDNVYQVESKVFVFQALINISVKFVNKAELMKVLI